MKHSIAFILAILLLVPALPVYGTTEPVNDKASHTIGFTDVPADHWTYDAINWMVVNGIVEGTGGNRYMPDRGVTREEFAKMMVLALELKLINKGIFPRYQKRRVAV